MHPRADTALGFSLGLQKARAQFGQGFAARQSAQQQTIRLQGQTELNQAAGQVIDAVQPAQGEDQVMTAVFKVKKLLVDEIVTDGVDRRKVVLWLLSFRAGSSSRTHSCGAMMREC